MTGDILANGEPVIIDAGNKVSDTEKSGFGDGAVGEASTPRSGKRKARDGQSPQTIKKKTSSLQQKNALKHLNDLKKGVKYIAEFETGSSHKPQFEVFMHVNGQDVIGRGRCKQGAKISAANAALATFDSPDAVNVNVINQRNGFEEVKADAIEIANEDNRKTPVARLNEMHPGRAYNLVEENPENPCQRFRISVKVNGKTYEGTGQKKELAKACAARAALSAISEENSSFLVKFLIAQSDDDDDYEDDYDDYDYDDDDVDDLFDLLPQELEYKMESMQLK